MSMPTSTTAQDELLNRPRDQGLPNLRYITPGPAALPALAVLAPPRP